MSKSSDAVEDDQSDSASTSDAGAEKRPGTKWVTREQFIQLLLSHHRLVRCDDIERGHRGLMDPSTGDCFLILQKDRLDSQSA